MKRLLIALLFLPGIAFATPRLPVVMGPNGLQQAQPGDSVTTQAPSTASAGFNLPHGTAPTSPANGDCWTTTAGLYCQINGVTVGPYSTGTPLPTIASGHLIANGTSGSAAAADTAQSAWLDQAFCATNGDILERGASVWACTPASSGPSTNQNTRAITWSISGNGGTISAGSYVGPEIDFNCTIGKVTLLADQSGSVTVDIWKVAYASYPPSVSNTITASDVPALSSAQKYHDSTLTGWTTSVSAGDTFWYHVTSPTSIQQLTVTLKCVASS